MVDTSEYFNKIRHFPVLSKEREIELINKLKSGDKSTQEEFIKCNLKLVVSVVKHYKDYADLEDLIQEGNIALFQAVERFDVERGNKFSTLATLIIKRHIYKYLGENKNIVKTTRHFNDKARKINKAREALRHQLNREPTITEISDKLELDPEMVSKTLQELPKSITILNDSEGNENAPKPGINESKLGANPTKGKLDININKEKLSEFFNTISERDREILSKRYGLDGDLLTHEEVATIFGISKGRVSQILNQINDNIKKELEASEENKEED